jgi:hypothetical protein
LALHREAFVRPPQGAGVERRARFYFSYSFSSMITGGYLPGIMGKMAHKKARIFQNMASLSFLKHTLLFVCKAIFFVYKRASKYTKTVQGGLCMDMKQIFHSIPCPVLNP